MWYNPHGNYPTSYGAADGLPNAFTYFGQTFIRRPDPIIVRKPPESPKSDSGSEATAPKPPSDRPDPPSNVPPQAWPAFPNPMTAMNMNAFSMFPPQPQFAPPQAVPQPPPSNHSSHSQQNAPSNPAKSVLKQPQCYTQPHPSMWPVIPSGHDAYALPHTTPLGAPVTSPLADKNAAHQPPLALDAHKYKCTICGRYRSARYHYKHPLLPGHLPKKTICRKCRENATDSDDASTDSYEAKQDMRSRSRSRRRAEEAVMRRAPSRSQSRGRRRAAKVSFQDDTSSSDSSHTVAGKHRKHRTPSSMPVTEIIRYVQGDPEHTTRRVRTVYVQEPPSQPFGTPHENAYVASEMNHQQRSGYASRPPTPAPPRVREEVIDTPSRQQCRLRTEYYDGTFPEMNNRRPQSHAPASAVQRPLNPQFRRNRSFDTPEHRYNKRHEYTHHHRRNDRDRRPYAHNVPGDDQAWIPRAPSPPGCSPRQVPRSSRYESQMSHQSRNDSPECGDNEVVVIETHEPEPKDDYDWYDENGMRVRVREI